MSKRFFKVVPLAAAVSAVMFTGNVLAEESTESVIQEVVSNPTDILTDGWTVNGYIRTGVRFTDKGISTHNEFGKPDYHTAGTTGHNANQVEFVIGKKTEFQNGVWSELGIRAEYGNGNSYFYSSPGSEAKNDTDEGRFEVKEAFMKLGGMDYLPEDAHVWAGRRFLNRSAGLLSGEFWKQSSGMGFGYEQSGTGIALVSVDPGEGKVKKDIEDKVGQRATMHSLDLYTYGHEGLGGSFDFDLKIMQQGSETKFKQAYGKDSATDGIGLAVTYNRDWYGFDGWSQTGLAYGEGMAANRGVNFGAWSGGFDHGLDGAGAATNKDAKTWFFTSYGVLNISDNWQMGSEVTYLYGKNIFGLSKEGETDTIHRGLVAVRPTYRVHDNFRWEWTASYAYQDAPAGWIYDEWSKGGSGPATGASGKANFYTVEMAGVFTVNADYFGRPQIKPFVTYLYKDAKEGYGWGEEFGKKKGVWQFGVEAEIWF
ncbi:hypothetical protein GZ77_10790 [Endozoicomonas montiporae]|uniref:Maltoporin n=2 Tax=Endozoicomonas montiporae TaxID=1027273 RepID=A0A081N8J4_9GAMM|nr:carbohydrate porin [Endozoicomonas montiporae]AMO55331.1 maltoporin [Endozoicomonas montiporae CL-33]KEQ14767.1 hypothetical protein GZ77_10790 [Endozoicomonas montiporae]